LPWNGFFGGSLSAISNLQSSSSSSLRLTVEKVVKGERSFDELLLKEKGLQTAFQFNSSYLHPFWNRLKRLNWCCFLCLAVDRLPYRMLFLTISFFAFMFELIILLKGTYFVYAETEGTK
jgi:hypothetical protein